MINCLLLPISEYLIYKFPEEAHLSAKEVEQKRHDEFIKNNPVFGFYQKIIHKDIDLNYRRK